MTDTMTAGEKTTALVGCILFLCGAGVYFFFGEWWQAVTAIGGLVSMVLGIGIDEMLKD